MNSRTLQFTQLGFSIIVMSSSGVLGKYINLPVPVTIWLRCVMGAMALFIFLKLTKEKTFIGWGNPLKSLIISSLFMAAHWLTYFWALKYSNVAIGMLSLFTYPVITAILEPILLKTKFKWPDLALAAMAFSGVFFLVPDFSFQNQVTLGILLGLFSALLYSLRNILLKNSVSTHSGTALMYNQLVIVALALLPVVFFFPLGEQLPIIKTDWKAISLLAFYTTALGHTLLVRSFKHFSITAISVITCLTPLLGIAQAYLFINEKPTDQVLIGGSIIMFSVFVESIRSIRKS